MSDHAPETANQKTGKVSGWFKALIGTVAGVCSGAFMMYLSPLIDKVVKPAKPVANFAVEHQGLTVTLHNRSIGHGDGWWDFGDGSPLEPLNAKQESVMHTYAGPGTYTAKMTLRNLLGEENERAVTIQLDTRPQVEPPTIVALDAVPVSAGAYAPATFRITSQSKNAELSVWDFGDDRPIEVNAESPNSQERMVTFNNPGGYVVKMVAVNGKQFVQKSIIVNVDEPPKGMVTAMLSVTEEATRVERVETPVTIVESFSTATHGNSQPINRQVPARQGFTITNARLEPLSGKGGKDLNLQVSADRSTVRLTGEFIRETAGPFHRNVAPENLVFRVVLAQERRTRVTRPATPVMTTLPAPGSGMIPLPPVPCDWCDTQRQLRLELRDGDRIVRAPSQLPHNEPVTVQNRRCTLNATLLGDQVRVDLFEIKPGVTPSAN